MTDWKALYEQLIAELAALDPIVEDPEEPNYCFFCDATSRYDSNTHTYARTHYPDCLYKRAQQMLLAQGIDTILEDQ